jgi:hypothetical protein
MARRRGDSRPKFLEVLYPPPCKTLIHVTLPFQVSRYSERTPLPNTAGYYLAKLYSHTSNRADYYKPFLVNYIFRIPIYLEATVFKIESSKLCLA